MISSSNDGKEAEKDLATPPRKKLKQARLSFQKLSPNADPSSPKNVKKRKISDDSGDEIKVIKVVKPNNEQSVNQESNLDSEVSDSKNDEKRSPSEYEIEDTCKDSKVSGNEPKENQENLKLETADSDIEQEHSKSEDEVKSNINAENKELEDENKGQETIFSSKDCLLETNTEEEKPISNNEIVIESQSDSSDAESDETSEGDIELNETVEELNSSGSCGDISKGDDLCQNSSENNLETDSKTPLTPQNNILKTNIIKKRKLTPKQLLQREEAAKKREEKEKQRKEKERMKAEEKEKRRKEKEEKEELKRKEKEEKEEQKRKEKEEKEKKKQAELEQKSEEKRLKEEERRKKEEQRVLEKRKKDEKKLAEEEAKRKEEEVKKKEAAAFANFFVASKGASKIIEEEKVKAAEHFMPFQVKADMRLAPLCRSNFDVARMESFDKKFKEQNTKNLYFDHLRKSSYIPGKSGKTWPLSDLIDIIIIDDDDDDVILASSSNEVVESHPTITHPKAKLLMFCENRRPPYWGTWTKKSKNIRPTCPFKKDEGFFDYEVDSDDEWEEEEPGESLHGSDDEKESEDEYEVDNEFFVPHGYLSDEENCEEEEVMNPETMKAKLKVLEMEFEEEMKHKTERIKPRLFGCFWASQKSDAVSARVLALLSSYRAVSQENPIVLSGPSTPEVNSPVHESQGTCPSTGSKKKKFPESFVPALIKLVHGNINGRGFLVKEFSSYMRKELETSRQEAEKDSENNQVVGNKVVSKLKISEKIKEIASWFACPDEGPFLNRMCWYVPSEIRVAYGLEDLVIPNKVWNYINAPKRELELSNTIPSPVVSETNSRPKSLPLITKFTKKLSQEERQRQLALSNTSSETEVENLDDVKVIPTSEDNGKIAGGDKSNKENSSANNEKIVAVNATSRKTDSETTNNGLKKSDSSGIRGKLLQFKSKGPSIIPHLEQRKRVPILKSVPLGQTFSPSTSKSSSTVAQEKQTNGQNEIKDTSEDVECVVID